VTLYGSILKINMGKVNICRHPTNIAMSCKCSHGYECGGNCFVNLVEKRARKELRGLFRDAKILVVSDGSCRGEVNFYLAKKLVSITHNIKKSSAVESEFDFVFLPNTADTEAEKFIHSMLGNGESQSPKAVKLLKNSLMKEVEKYAKIKGIEYEIPDEPKSDEAEMLDGLENKYKGTKFALVKVSKELEN